jgi:2,4-didehydro-3-deoxy-L-rhamnonate hydrolase
MVTVDRSWQNDQIPFVLGMFSVSGSPAFPALVLDDQAVISVEAIRPLAASLGHALSGAESVFGLLQNWDQNFAGLCASVMALNDATLGKYYRSHVAAIEFFEPLAPIPEPRQVFCDTDGDAGTRRFVAKLPSSVCGPKAKILVAEGVDQLVAEVKLGTVIARPTYRVSEVQAAAAVAGYITVTDLTRRDMLVDPANWLAAKSGPTYLPTGPYFVPAAFAGKVADMDMVISLNGQRNVASTAADLIESPSKQIAGLSAFHQLFAGDIICATPPLSGGLVSLQPIGEGDIIEAAISGLGQQTTNSMQEALD